MTGTRGAVRKKGSKRRQSLRLKGRAPVAPRSALANDLKYSSPRGPQTLRRWKALKGYRAVLQRRSKALTRMWSWNGPSAVPFSTAGLYAGSIIMTNAVRRLAGRLAIIGAQKTFQLVQSRNPSCWEQRSIVRESALYETAMRPGRGIASKPGGSRASRPGRPPCQLPPTFAERGVLVTFWASAVDSSIPVPTHRGPSSN